MKCPAPPSLSADQGIQGPVLKCNFPNFRTSNPKSRGEYAGLSTLRGCSSPCALNISTHPFPISGYQSEMPDTVKPRHIHCHTANFWSGMDHTDSYAARLQSIRYTLYTTIRVRLLRTAMLTIMKRPNFKTQNL